MAKKIARVGKLCVACGVCVRECPFGAISIYKGLYSQINAEKCVGCGTCAKICPASVIEIISRESINEN